MKKLLVLPIIALLLLLMASCEQDQMEPLTNSENQQMITTRFRADTIPFKGFYTTYPDVTGPVNGVLTAIINSDGNATHLGKSTWFSNSLVSGVGGPLPWTQTGDQTFTAANGDQLIGSFVGITAPDPPNPFAGSGDYIITSGSGRFDGYTGAGTYSYYVVPEFIGYLVFDGFLIKP